jgi:hypothetical protein
MLPHKDLNLTLQLGTTVTTLPLLLLSLLQVRA